MTSRLKRKSRTMPLRNLKVSNALCNMTCDRAAEQESDIVTFDGGILNFQRVTTVGACIPESYHWAVPVHVGSLAGVAVIRRSLSTQV